jgi:TPR repeat protein
MPVKKSAKKLKNKDKSKAKDEAKKVGSAANKQSNESAAQLQPDSNAAAIAKANHIAGTFFALASQDYQNGNYAKALENFQKVADNLLANSIIRAGAHLRLGSLYWNAHGTERDDNKALNHFIAAAKLGDNQAAVILAGRYLSGNPAQGKIEQEVLQQLLPVWHVEALKGQFKAQLALAGFYRKGSDKIPADQVQSFKYVSMAVNNPQVDPVCLENLLRNFLINRENKKLNLVDDVSYFQIAKLMAERFKNQIYLGECYFKGQGTQISMAKAAACFEKDYKTNEESVIDLAKCHFEEEAGWQNDPQKAIKMLEEVAGKKGKSAGRASYVLAIYYHKKNDIEKTVYWLKISVSYKHAAAAKDLYTLYCQGVGVDKDEDEAYRILDIAAEAGDLEALTLSAIHNLRKNKEPEKTLQYLNFAVAQKYPRAFTTLAHCYQHGKCGLAVSEAFALKLVEEGVQLQDAASQYLLGEYYQTGNCGVKEDLEKTQQYYELATKQNYLPAKIELANLLIRKGTDESFQRAFLLLYNSVDELNDFGHQLLAICYQYGQGTVIDHRRALQHYKIAGRSYPFAEYMRAQYLLYGIVGKKDCRKAFEILNNQLNKMGDFESFALKQDLLNVADNLNSFNRDKANFLMQLAYCCLYGMGTEVNLAKGISFLEQAAELQEGAAQEMLARFYELGAAGVTQDLVKAQKLYQLAAQNANQAAKQYVEWKKTLKEENDKIFVEIASIPYKFQVRRNSPNYNFLTLMAAVQAKHQSIQAFKSKVLVNDARNSQGLIEGYQKIESAMLQATQLLERATELTTSFEGRYKVCYEEVSKICLANKESAGAVLKEFQDSLLEYERCFRLIKVIDSNFEKFLSELDAVSKTIVASQPKTAADIKTAKALQTENEITELKKQQKSLKEMKKQQELDKKSQQREAEREVWKAKTKKHHEDLLKKQQSEKKPNSSFSAELQEELAYNFSVIRERNSSAAMVFHRAPTSNWADWQPDLQLRIIEEENLLAATFSYMQECQKKATAKNQKDSLEDLWIEREVLVGLLGRLMELKKEVRGKNIALPIGPATDIRNVLLKYSYFNEIPENPQANQAANPFAMAEEQNKQLRLAVKNVLIFFSDKKNQTGVKNTWEQVKAEINSPLLNDIVAKSKTPSFQPKEMSLDECKKRVKEEENKLLRLKQYKGIYAEQGSRSQDLFGIVDKAIKARFGTVSAYVKLHKPELFKLQSDQKLSAEDKV